MCVYEVMTREPTKVKTHLEANARVCRDVTYASGGAAVHFKEI